MSTLNLKIDNHVGGSGATPSKQMAYVMYGLGLALYYIYNAYLYIPKTTKLFLSSACGRSYHTISEPR